MKTSVGVPSRCRVLMMSMVLLSALSLATHGAAGAATVPEIYVFGDGYVDSGRGSMLSAQAVDKKVEGAFLLPADPALARYDQDGHWSNGPTAVEILADGMNLTLGEKDYAVGGAKSDHTNYYTWLDKHHPTGIQAQIDDFLGGSGKVSEEALYFVGIGANDFFFDVEVAKTGDLNGLAETAAVDTAKAVTRLADAGARKFLVSTAYDLAGVPAVTQANMVADAEKFVEVYNERLTREVAAVRQARAELMVTLFHWGAESRKIAADPGAHGITNTTDACRPVLVEQQACANPGEYLWWDEYRPSARLHQLIAAAMQRILDKSL